MRRCLTGPAYESAGLMGQCSSWEWIHSNDATTQDKSDKRRPGATWPAVAGVKPTTTAALSPSTVFRRGFLAEQTGRTHCAPSCSRCCWLSRVAAGGAGCSSRPAAQRLIHSRPLLIVSQPRLVVRKKDLGNKITAAAYIGLREDVPQVSLHGVHRDHQTVAMSTVEKPCTMSLVNCCSR